MDSKPETASEELSNLRARVEELSDPVAPALASATDQVKRQAQQAKAAATDEVEKAAQMVRQSPIAAVLMATLAGYAIGRIVR